jgi:hypothetical protein
VKVLETMTCGMLRGLLEGALGMVFLPSTDGTFNGVVVPKGKELALSLQLVIKSFLPNPFYGPVRPERLRRQSGHQLERVNQRIRQNLLQARQHYRFVLGAMEPDERSNLIASILFRFSYALTLELTGVRKCRVAPL